MRWQHAIDLSVDYESTWRFRRPASALLSGPFQPTRADSAPAFFAASHTIAFTIILVGVAAFLSVFFSF